MSFPALAQSYSATEYATRKVIFEKNKDLVLEHNALYRAGEESWYAALNHLADYTTEEFKTLRATKYDPTPFTVQGYSYSGTNPASIDWRTKDVVTPVKNQGGCGSCWAFSATEQIESDVQRELGEKYTLSPQQITSCDTCTSPLSKHLSLCVTSFGARYTRTHAPRPAPQTMTAAAAATPRPPTVTSKSPTAW